MAIPTIVEILDINLKVVTPLKSLMPFNKSGTMLQYSRELSDYGKCKLRISAYDPIFTTYGDVIQPHKYHIRIRKGTTIVWQGAIVDNPKRNKTFIDILAVEYEFYLKTTLINRTSPDVNGTTDIYRTFSSGTMAAAVTAIMTESLAKYTNTTHVLSSMTLGTIDNPNFPPNMVSDYVNNGTNVPLTGGWNFGTGIQTAQGPQLQFDYHTVYYILKVFGIYSYADFKINNQLQFNFRSFYGNNLLSSFVFAFGQQGNVVDYALPRLGQRVVNSLTAIATDPNGVILHVNPNSQTAISQYGLLEGVAAYTDVKSQSILNARGAAEIGLISVPDESNATVVLDENGYPRGQYDIGDIITIKVTNLGVNFNQIRRIVGITVTENETGREEITIQSNQPQSWQYPNA